MTNLLLHEYYYRYREKRQLIKNQLVDTGNYTTAKEQLETTIAEHQAKFPDSDTRKDFNYGEKLIMNHSLNHLNAVINKNDPEYRDEEGNLKHQSDIVKLTLLEVPPMSEAE